MNRNHSRPETRNRFREMTIAFPSDVADIIKRRAHEQKVTEQEVVKRLVMAGLTTNAVATDAVVA